MVPVTIWVVFITYSLLHSGRFSTQQFCGSILLRSFGFKSQLQVNNFSTTKSSLACVCLSPGLSLSLRVSLSSCFDYCSFSIFPYLFFSLCKCCVHEDDNLLDLSSVETSQAEVSARFHLRQDVSSGNGEMLVEKKLSRVRYRDGCAKSSNQWQALSSTWACRCRRRRRRLRSFRRLWRLGTFNSAKRFIRLFLLQELLLELFSM